MGQSMTHEQYIAKRKELLLKQAHAYHKMIWTSDIIVAQVAEREINEICRQVIALDKAYYEQLAR